MQTQKINQTDIGKLMSIVHNLEYSASNHNALEKTITDLELKYFKDQKITDLQAKSIYIGHLANVRKKEKLTKLRAPEIVDKLHLSKGRQKTLRQINTLILYHLKSEPLRRLFINYFIDGLHQKEIAKKEGVLQSTISRRLEKLNRLISKMLDVKALLTENETIPLYNVQGKGYCIPEHNTRPSAVTQFDKRYLRTYPARQAKVDRRKPKLTFKEQAIKNYSKDSYKSLLRKYEIYTKPLQLNSPIRYYKTGALIHKGIKLVKFNTKTIYLNIPNSKDRLTCKSMINNFLTDHNIRLSLTGLTRSKETYLDIKDQMIKFYNSITLTRSTI